MKTVITENIFQNWLIRTRLLIAIFVVFFAISGAVYLGAMRYQDYRAEKIRLSLQSEKQGASATLEKPNNMNEGYPQSTGSNNSAVEITPEVKPEKFNLVTTPAPTNKQVTITGIVADCRYAYGLPVGIPDVTVGYADKTVSTDKQGLFSITIPGIDPDPLFKITAPGFVPYSERLSRMIENSFYLIPEALYRGLDLVLWNSEQSNPQNWHRKWEKQTEFVIVRTGASEEQINTVLTLLAQDEYRKMTGGRFTSAVQPTIVDQIPMGKDREGKTVILFTPGIISGGIAHSEDRNGAIYYAEITWDTNQVVDRVVFWHEMLHTATAGGHINEWPSVVSEVNTTGYATEMDEQILNCIYNSPPQRTQPNH